MMKNKLFQALVLGLALVACTAKKAPTTRIRMRLPTEPPTLDWDLATDNVSKEIIFNIQQGLLRHDADTKPIPALAESYEISKDATAYTFKIRKDAKWSDGRDLVAQDFVDAWERVLNPKTASEYAYFLFDLKNAKEYQSGALKDFSQVGVKATDAKTLVVNLKGPTAYWLHIPAFWISFPIRKDIVEKYGDRWTDVEHIVSSGPYKLKEWHRDSKIVLELDPNYYDKQADRIPEVEFRIVKDDSVAVSLFETGDLDIVRNLPPSQLRSLAKTPEFRSSPYLRLTYFGFNIKDPAVADPKVRKALAMAVDRSEIEKLLTPMAKASAVWIPVDLAGADAERGIKTDVAAAKALWAQVKNPPKELEIWFDQNETYKLVAENLQNQWSRNLGVNVKLSSQEWKVYLKQLSTKAPAIYRMGWGADYPDPATFMDLFTCASGNNFTGFCNATYDKNIQQSGISTDPALRQKLYSEAQKIFLEDETAIIPLFQEQSMHLVGSRVANFKADLIGDFFFDRLRFK
ncbi:MAG: peptide ABC transporter substrate-binding protein [Bdellovibrionota bacterium]